MHKVLEEIVAKTREEVEKRKSKIQAGTPGVAAQILDTRRMFTPDQVRGGNDIVLIAEIKLASPSAGKLGEKGDVLKKVMDYEKAGADMISVVTEKNYFSGDLELVPTVKSKTNLPVLQKDFIIDPYQVYEAKKLGADYLLLIARIVTQNELINLVDLCLKQGIEPVVEICSEADLESALSTKTKIIAVNARDLDTFEVSVDRACLLLHKIPDGYIKLGFSGVKSKAEVEKYLKAGAKGVLIGTELMKSKNPGELIQKLKSKPRDPSTSLGMTRLESASD